MSAWPEHEKLGKVSARSQAIGEFLEWLGHEHVICTWGSVDDMFDREGYRPTRKSIEELLAEFFEIDLAVIETEKRAMLAQIREGQNL